MRVPAGGRFESAKSGRIVIQPLPPFGFMRKLPVNVAPAASNTSSPGCAESRAPCRSPPAATRICRPVAPTYRVSTYARGSSARREPVGGGGCVTGAVTVMDSVPITLPFVARACAEPALMPVARPRPATPSTLVLELLHVNAVLGTSVPFASRATAVICTPSPVDSDVFAADSVMLAIGPAPVTLIPIDPLVPSDDTRMVAAPPETAVTTPFALTVATEGAELENVSVRPVRIFPWASRSVTAICVMPPTMSDVAPAETEIDATG